MKRRVGTCKLSYQHVTEVEVKVQARVKAFTHETSIKINEKMLR